MGGGSRAFDGDSLDVYAKIAMDHEPTLTGQDARPAFLPDWPGIVLAESVISSGLLWREPPLLGVGP
jgi:hypothetical protein